MNNRAVALAGVMGGEDTEIDEKSQVLVLESAYFPSATNRRSAKSVGIRTEASARFERGVDPGTCRAALYRAIDLLVKHAGAEYVNLTEQSVKASRELEVTLRYKRMDSLLGLSIDREHLSKILRKLGFLMKPSKEPDKIQVSIPTFRQQDVYREIDLIEEIIRIYGYNKVPYTLPQKSASVAGSVRRRLIRSVRSVMAGAGLSEVVTTSLIGEALLEKTGFTLDRNQAVSVSNSHSEDHTILRQSVLPNLLEVAKFNQAQGQEDVWIYEIGRTYFKKGKPAEKQTGVVEKLVLSALVSGSTMQGTWHRKAPTEFYLVKGLVERLFDGVLPAGAAIRFEADKSQPFLHPGKTASFSIVGAQQKSVGFVGELHPAQQSLLKFRQPVYLIEVDLEAVYKFLKQQSDKPTLLRLSAYPSVKRDVAFSAPETLSHQRILEAVQGLKNPLIRSVELFDEYRGQQLGAGQRSLAYRLTLQSDEATLTDAEIDDVMARVRQTLADSLDVTLR
jgi:phenylalanyl-tRNA synthetase beta chain